MITLAELLIGLKNRLQVAMEQHDLNAVQYLSHTFTEMLEASYGDGNEKFCALLENLEYATNHIGLADWKAKDAIPTDEQINDVFRSNESS